MITTQNKGLHVRRGNQTYVLDRSKRKSCNTTRLDRIEAQLKGRVTTRLSRIGQAFIWNGESVV